MQTHIVAGRRYIYRGLRQPPGNISCLQLQFETV